MPRSHAVWVVTSELYPWPKAAFTVKHELESWWDAQPHEQRCWYHVWRCENPMWNSGGRTGAMPDYPRPVEVYMGEATDVLAT